jgi:biopolymer transport protein ExbD
MNQATINVTPLIDVLLVLLIIFMVVTPLGPSAFKARIPSEPTNINERVTDHPDTLVVEIASEGSIKLNSQDAGNTGEMTELTETLRQVFAERIGNGNVSDAYADTPERPFTDRVERTVFIKAPASINYGTVARVIDAIKLGGAFPISLQIDRLDR